MTDIKELQELGIFLKDNELLTMAFSAYRALAMLPVVEGMHILILDLDNLPTEPFSFKEIFLKWWLQANEARISKGEDPILTYSIAKLCPVWKLVPMPIRPLGATKLFKLPPIKTIGKKQLRVSINKR